MKTRALMVALVLAACVVAVAGAANGPVPPIVVSGLTAYKADGAEAAVRVWMTGSPIERSEQARGVIGSLREFENLYGQYRTFQVVRTVTISPTCQMSYIQLDYEKGPAFGKLLVYTGPLQTVVVSFMFSTDPERIWAFSLFGSPEEL